MIRKLSFELSFADDKAEDGRPYRVAHISPRLDGRFMFGDNQPGPLFDALTVIVRGCAEPSTLDLFTCSCGVAGCAGIFDDVAIGVTSNQVTWTFPEEYFREALSPHLFPDDVPMTVQFSRRQYQEALDGLEYQLNEAEKSAGVPVVVPPDSHPDESLDVPFETLMAEYRERYSNWRAECKLRAARYGNRAYQEVAVTFPNGECFGASLENVVDALVPADEDDDLYIESRLPAILSDEAVLFSLMKAASWETFYNCMWHSGDTPETEASPEDLEKMWPDAQISLTPL